MKQHALLRVSWRPGLAGGARWSESYDGVL